MAEAVTLRGLLRHGRDPEAVFAWRRGEPVRYAEFDRAARAWRAAFAAAPGHRYVLDFSDAIDFAAALFGAWHARKCVLMPTETQKGALAQLGVAVDGVAGDGGGLVPAAPSSQPWDELDAETPLFELFTSGSTGAPVAIAKVLRQLRDRARGRRIAAVVLYAGRARARHRLAPAHVRLRLPALAADAARRRVRIAAAVARAGPDTSARRRALRARQQSGASGAAAARARSASTAPSPCSPRVDRSRRTW